MIYVKLKYEFFENCYYLYYGEKIALLTIGTYPRRYERKYKFYLDKDKEGYKIIYADTTKDAINKGIKIIKKNLYKEIMNNIEIFKSSWEKHCDSEEIY